MASRHFLKTLNLAKRGDASAQLALGQIYLRGGEGLAENQASALHWLEMAANAGLAEAALMIGEEISPDLISGSADVIRMLRQAVGAGSTNASVCLARVLLAKAASVQADNELDSEAAGLLRKASQAGHVVAKSELGAMLLRSPRSDGDEREGCRLLAEAYEAGEAQAASHLADYHWRHRHLAEALTWYRRVDDAEDPEIVFRIAYLKSMAGNPDLALFEKAASRGHVRASEELGAHLAFAQINQQAGGARRRLKRSAYWLEYAATKGSARAPYLLAMVYRHPDYSMRDVSKSREWLFRSAQGGHHHARLLAGIELVRDLSSGRLAAVREARRLGQNPVKLAASYLVDAQKAGFAEARQFLERLADCRRSRSERLPPRDVDRFVDFVHEADPDLAARVRLGLALALTTRELLAIDLAAADQGDHLFLEIHGRTATRRRIILLDSEHKRAVVSSVAKEVQPPVSRSNGAVPPKYRKLQNLCKKYGDAEIFEYFYSRSTEIQHLPSVTAPSRRVESDAAPGSFESH